MSTKFWVKNGVKYTPRADFPQLVYTSATDAANGTYLQLPGLAARLPDEPLPIAPVAGQYRPTVISTADLRWLADTMTPADGSKPYLEGINVDRERMVSSLRGHMLRAVRVVSDSLPYYPTLTPVQVAAFLALPGLGETVEIYFSDDLGAVEMHDPASGQGVYSPTRNNGEEWPVKSATEFLTENHPHRHPWGKAEKLLFSRRTRESFMVLPLKSPVKIDAGLLADTPDGFICYGKEPVRRVLIAGAGDRTVCVATCGGD